MHAQRLFLIATLFLGASACPSNAVVGDSTLPATERGVERDRGPDRGSPTLWAVSAGGPAATISVTRVAVDGASNIYVAGSVTGAAQLGTLSAGRAGQTVAFLAKLSPAGVFLWVVELEGVSGVSGLAVDADGNSHLAGGFNTNAKIGGLAVSGTWSSMFVAKVDPAGQALWAILATYDGPPPDPQQCCCVSCSGRMSPGAVAVDAEGDIFVIGDASLPATFGAITLDASAGPLFVARLGPSGHWKWVSTAAVEGGIYGHGSFLSIAVGAGGHIALAGDLYGKMVLGNTTLNQGGGVFAARVSSDGDFVWATQDVVVEGGSVLSDLAVDAVGSSTLAGWNGPSFFVARLDAGGKVQWVKTTRFSDYYCPVVPQIAVAAQGETHLVGRYCEALSTGALTLPAPNDRALFLARMSPSGDVASALASGSSPGVGRNGLGFALDGQGNQIVAATFNWPTLFGGTALTPSGSPGDEPHDLFVWKLRLP
jgi:hypothetical protein